MALRRVKIGMEAELEATEAAEGFYVGVTPPPGSYRCAIVNGKYNEANKNGDTYYTIRVRIAHDEDAPKARFNGYSRQTNITFSASQLKYVKQFQEAAGFSSKDMNNPGLDDDDYIIKLGMKDIAGVILRVGFVNGTYNGQRTLEAKTFSPDTGEIEGDDVADVTDEPAGDEYDEYGADESYTGEPDADEYTEDEPAADDGDEYADDDAGEDQPEDDGEADEYTDDEPAEPVKAAPRKAVKAPPAKAPAKKAPAKAAARKPW